MSEELANLSISSSDSLMNFLSKADQMKQIINDPSNESFNTHLNQMIKSLEEILAIISSNHDFLANTALFKDDFQNSINTISIAIESYAKSIKSITNPIENPESINLIKNDITNFSDSLNIFSTNIQEIISNIAAPDQAEDQITILNTRLALESTLFNLCVKFQKIDEFPFFKSKYTGVYRCYNTINNITEPVAAIKSFCGTGKTSIIPLIFLIRSLKENFKTPFVILTQPTPKHVENKAKFFNSIISQYGSIITDPNKLIEIFNEHEKQNQKKLIFAILTPHDLLPFLFKLRGNKSFYSSTRIIIDEIHQRTFHLDVLITKISDLYLKKNAFQIPLNITFMSASIYPNLLSPFEGKVTITSLITSSQFEVIEKPPINEHFIDKINNEIVRDEAIKVIEEMAKIHSTIERGHILCFLNLVKICHSVNDSVLSLLNDNEETEERRKIVFLRTKFKSNESIESFFKRLQNEYKVNEEIREANIDNYKHDFFYVLPLVFSGVTEEPISELVLNEFPGELKKITKLISSTPLSESFNYENLSVVIDSGLIKQPGFDIKTGLTTVVETQASKETMLQRKGRLGRSMKGLYIPIMLNKDQPEIQIPPIKRLDLTTNILLMKDIEINFEKMNNLPDVPDNENIQFALHNLMKINAIDKKNSSITQFGHEILKFPFISIYYAAAVIQMREKYYSDNKNDAYFIGVYLLLIISMSNSLVNEEMSENLSRYFCEESDIVTLFNAINYLIKSDSTNQFKELVESFGFSYYDFLQLKNHLQKVVDVTHFGEELKEIIIKIEKVENLKEKVMKIIDQLIEELKLIDSNWGDVHHIKFRRVQGAGGLKRSPFLFFMASSKNLRFKKQRTSMAEVVINKRPGWNGISIPTDCYCFNISRKMLFQTNSGRLIHRALDGFKSAIKSIEVDSVALNPWFIVLLNHYLKDEKLEIPLFRNDSSNTKTEENEEGQIIHLSNIGGRAFISFISCLEKDQLMIKNAIKKCLAVLPFSPKGIIIYRSDLDTLIELRLIGTENYDVVSIDDYHGDYLDKQKIDYCVKNIDKLKTSDPEILICSLFVKETCKLNEYVQKKLFFIDKNSTSMPLIFNTVKDEIKKFNEQAMKLKQTKNSIKSEVPQKQEKNFFEFPPRFIHPALLVHQKSLECILNWFSKHCDYAHVIRVIGHRILMKSSEIRQLQIHIQKEGNKIKEQMNLNYEAIPVPSKIYSRSYLSIKENPLWKYDDHFKCIVTTKEEAVKVIEFIKKVQTEIDEIEFSKNKNKPDSSIADNTLSDCALCCLYTCEDPSNPVLSNIPLTLYFKDGSTYTSRICRDCILGSIQNSIFPFINNKGCIEPDAVHYISIKPTKIATFQSYPYENIQEYWPQIPIGQLISLLINNDPKTSIAISLWLNIVAEYAIRAQFRSRFIFCPLHPHQIVDRYKCRDSFYKCLDPSCNWQYCDICYQYHEPLQKCKPLDKNIKFCPMCKTITLKDQGCNHIRCQCGCDWCYLCGLGFANATECYDHLDQVHGGYWG